MEQQAIIDSIHRATVGIFSTMLSLDVKPGPIRNERANPTVQDGVMSFVSLDGPWVGTGVMSCTSGVACRFSAALLMMPEVPAMNEEVLDCVRRARAGTTNARSPHGHLWEELYIAPPWR
jgi:CheY-specific phosphatase CheX